MPSAVIVIDVQAALCAGDDAAFDAVGVIDRINAVTREARAKAVPDVRGKPCSAT
jgi:nicotinamidase-related amidase